jgi:hypothetical protein
MVQLAGVAHGIADLQDALTVLDVRDDEAAGTDGYKSDTGDRYSVSVCQNPFQSEVMTHNHG